MVICGIVYRHYIFNVGYDVGVEKGSDPFLLPMFLIWIMHDVKINIILDSLF